MTPASAPAREVETTTVRFLKSVVEKAAIVARRRDVTVGDYLTGIFEKTLDRDYRKEVAAMSAELGGES